MFLLKIFKIINETIKTKYMGVHYVIVSFVVPVHYGLDNKLLKIDILIYLFKIFILYSSIFSFLSLMIVL